MLAQHNGVCSQPGSQLLMSPHSVSINYDDTITSSDEGVVGIVRGAQTAFAEKH
jgi:hypothetical protein